MIRLRDCKRTTGSFEYAQCVTCGVVYHFKKLQAGHFLPGRNNSILFNEKNCHAQCHGCNMFKMGNTVKYFRFMQKEYGDEVIEELERLDRQTKKFTIPELQDLQEEFKRRIKEMEEC